MAGDFCCVRTVDLRITQKGIEFLQKSSSIQRAQTFLKEMKQIILGVLTGGIDIALRAPETVLSFIPGD